MDIIDLLALKAELAESICLLNHGKTEIQYQAVDYLTVPLGKRKGCIEEADGNFLNIPICKECADALCESEWILNYCLSCCSSQWMCRELARKSYPLDCHVIWYTECPKCKECA